MITGQTMSRLRATRWAPPALHIPRIISKQLHSFALIVLLSSADFLNVQLQAQLRPAVET